MTKQEMEKKIQQLERRIDFLLLQLKIINQEAESYLDKDYIERLTILNTIGYYSKAQTIKDNFSYIEKNDLKYNFYNELMNINDYNLDERKENSL